MATGRALPGAGLARQAAARRAAAIGAGLLRPLRAVWWLLTNVRFAIVLLAALSLVSLLGVVLPQVPTNVRGDALAEARWLDAQEGKFGPFTSAIDAAGLFDLFHTRWFSVLMAVTVGSTGAYIASRFPGIWRTVTRPRRRVPDRYFQMAPHRLELAQAVDIEALEGALRRARYRVERFPEGDATYLFADRFQWAQLGTLFTHAAVILFIVAAAVSRMDAFSADLFLSEGSTEPVFAVKSPDQMQVELTDAVGLFAVDGQPLDYRSRLVIYRRGEEVKRCESTVNSPCSYDGFRFFQAAYFGFGAALEVRDATTGNVVYRETLALSDSLPSPHVVIREGDGRVLLDESLALTDALSTDEFTYFGTVVELAGGRVLTAGARRPAAGGEWELAVFEPGEGDGLVRLVLPEGAAGRSGGLEVRYLDEGKAPAALVADLPGSPEGEDGGRPVLVQMGNVVYGTDTASEGTAVEAPAAQGPPRLTLAGLSPRAVSMEPGESATFGGYEYRFLGQREFAGIQVKRDRSDYLVWVGAGLVFIGLVVTFWVPRRRLWAKITADGTFLAGQAASHSDYAREMRRLTRKAGASPPEEPEDDE